MEEQSGGQSSMDKPQNDDVDPKVVKRRKRQRHSTQDSQSIEDLRSTSSQESIQDRNVMKRRERQLLRYHSMTDEEKRKHNQQSYARTKARLEKQKMNASVTELNFETPETVGSSNSTKGNLRSYDLSQSLEDIPSTSNGVNTYSTQDVSQSIEDLRSTSSQEIIQDPKVMKRRERQRQRYHNLTDEEKRKRSQQRYANTKMRASVGELNVVTPGTMRFSNSTSFNIGQSQSLEDIPSTSNGVNTYSTQDVSQSIEDLRSTSSQEIIQDPKVMKRRERQRQRYHNLTDEEKRKRSQQRYANTKMRASVGELNVVTPGTMRFSNSTSFNIGQSQSLEDIPSTSNGVNTYSTQDVSQSIEDLRSTSSQEIIQDPKVMKRRERQRQRYHNLTDEEKRKRSQQRYANTKMRASVGELNVVTPGTMRFSNSTSFNIVQSQSLEDIPSTSNGPIGQGIFSNSQYVSQSIDDLWLTSNQGSVQDCCSQDLVNTQSTTCSSSGLEMFLSDEDRYTTEKEEKRIRENERKKESRQLKKKQYKSSLKAMSPSLSTYDSSTINASQSDEDVDMDIDPDLNEEVNIVEEHTSSIITPARKRGKQMNVAQTPSTVLSREIENLLVIGSEESMDESSNVLPKKAKLINENKLSVLPVKKEPRLYRRPEESMTSFYERKNRLRPGVRRGLFKDNSELNSDHNENEDTFTEEMNRVVEDERASPVEVIELSDARAARITDDIERSPPPATLNKKKSRIIGQSGRNFNNIDNTVPDQLHLGDIGKCPFCDAYTFTYICCDLGKVRIPPPRSHPYIRKLLTGEEERSKEFRKNVVAYNTSLAMGSISYVREKTTGSYPFVKVNGMIQHLLSGVLPPMKGKSIPMFHQIYKYDVNEATNQRTLNLRTGTLVKPRIMRNLHMIMEEENYLIKQYKTARDIQKDMLDKKIPLKNIYLVLRAPHEVHYQGPEALGCISRPKQEMESIIYQADEDGAPGKHGVSIVHRQFGGKIEVLGYWNPLLDPLEYPILFPYGSSGFKRENYRLEENYVTPEPFFDDVEPYPFEHLNDECDKGDSYVDYERARLKWKERRRQRDEDVSESEDGDNSDCETDNELEVVGVVRSTSDAGELRDEMQIDMDDQECQIVDKVNDETIESNEDICPMAIEEDEEEPEMEQIDLEYENVDNVPDGRHEFLADSSDDEVHIDSIDQVPEGMDIEESNAEDVNRRKELWKKKEKEIIDKVMRRQERELIKYFKLKDFKALCLERRDDDAFISSLFDSSESRNLQIDLDYIERTNRKQKGYLYWLAGFLFEYPIDVIESHYADKIDELQLDIDYEISMIMDDPSYRKDDPKIKEYRLKHLMLTEQDDNREREVEEEHDVVQRDVVGNEYLDLRKKKMRKPVQAAKGSRIYVSRRQHALHQFQVRSPSFHPYLSALMLGQLYLIDVVLRIIRQRNDNAREHVIKLRGSHENTITYQIHNRAAAKKGFTLGYAFQLTNERVGSTAWYKEQFENAMAVMDKCGKPDLFITMTGNPDWPEIKENLLPESSWQSNPFLVNDVFYLKMQELLHDIKENQIFGPVVAWCFSIEFQKRGMPHMHLLVTLADRHKLDSSDKIDDIIKTTIPPVPDDDDPDKARKQRYRDNVCQHMLHTSCIGNPNAYCCLRPPVASNRTYTRCTKYYPFYFNTHTSTQDGGKVDYHRPDDGITYTKYSKINGKAMWTADNRHVIAHNPFLLNKYGCHINVEAVTTVDVVKYIYKYIYKGFDKALAQFIEASEVDDGAGGRPPRAVVHASKESSVGVMAPHGLKATTKVWKDYERRMKEVFRQFDVTAKPGERLTAYDEAIMVECFRQMTASEAAWITQKHPMASQSHSVVNIAVHKEGEQPIFFRQGELEQVMKKIEEGKYKSMFIAWFDLNKRDPFARQFTYNEIPIHYAFEKNANSREWRRYKLNMTARNIVRVRPVSPRNLEAFAIRLLAMNQRGPRSYEELFTVNDTVYPTAMDAARALGLMDAQVEFHLCLQEMIGYQFPNRLRSLFASILVFGHCTDPLALWNAFYEHFYDRKLLNNPTRARDVALYHIEHLISEHGYTLENFNLPSISSVSALSQQDIDLALDGVVMEDVQDLRAKALNLRESLSEDQKAAFNAIRKAVINGGRDTNCFFLQGSGGCGKTYLYRALHDFLKYEDGFNVSMIATTGIAATLLKNGSTAHRKFMLPLNCVFGSRSSMKVESQQAKELGETAAFIIDEATMASRFAFEAIDQLLRDITGNQNKPFGGKIMLLGGDWKQLLPVVAGASSTEAIEHTLKRDQLWENFKVLTLHKNMRAQADPEYATLLENVGNGLVNGHPDTSVRMPTRCIVQTAEEVIDYIYPDMSMNPAEVAKSCVLASLNAETMDINEKVIDRLPGTSQSYFAMDVPREGIGMQVPPEYFRNDMPSGMPPYELKLKVGAIVILLRNQQVSQGMCNGSRLQVTKLFKHSIEAKLLTTEFAGSLHIICKIQLDPPAKGKKNSNYTRFQLPVRLAYAMTINKAQGQTFDRVGVILKNNVFSHGQLYVALSRARESEKVRLCSMARGEVNGRRVVIVRNKVERSILEALPLGSLIDPNYIVPDYVDAVDEEVQVKKVPGRKYVHDHSRPQSDKVLAIFNKMKNTTKEKEKGKGEKRNSRPKVAKKNL